MAQACWVSRGAFFRKIRSLVRAEAEVLTGVLHEERDSVHSASRHDDAHLQQHRGACEGSEALARARLVVEDRSEELFWVWCTYPGGRKILESKLGLKKEKPVTGKFMRAEYL